ncbi:MAG: hypothetical protein JWO95_1211 [Verrucomicrobiales bacterium]|nr:hypothetical protein [Verrucomicrobiales bacterium]
MSYQLEVRQPVKDFYENLAPAERRAVKKALAGLMKEQGDIRALRERLEGYYRLRVGVYRIIFRYLEGRNIQCVYMNYRAFVYDVFETEGARIVVNRKGGTSSQEARHSK